MIDLTNLWLFAGFGFILVVGALMGAGTDLSLIWTFQQPDPRDWPQGVQEMDVPRFNLDHIDALRPTRSS